jgi:glycosyltransferase involved in cell wall biosynthesis
MAPLALYLHDLSRDIRIDLPDLLPGGYMLISIITAVRNAESTLSILLDSLVGQEFRDFELVLQDGASTDGTLMLVERYRALLPPLSLQSEPDSGIYDAWNKAVSRASGDWLIFLGADDRFADDQVLADVAPLLRLLPRDVVFAAGEGEMRFSDGSLFSHMSVDVQRSKQYLEVGCPVCHASLFYRKSLFETEEFDVRFKVAGDYDFLCRHWNVDKVRAINRLVTVMQAGGVSASAKYRSKALKETLIIAKRTFGHYPSLLLKSYVKSVLHGVIITILGVKLGNRFYDLLRILNGNSPCWSKTER